MSEAAMTDDTRADEMRGDGGGDVVRWLTDDEQVSWRAYLRASRELIVAFDRDLQDVGISLPEYELMSMLSEAPDAQMRMSAVAAFIVQSRSRVTHTAARLERRGWVRRTPAPDDGRGVLLRLTEGGRDSLDAFAVAHVGSVRRHLIDVLTTDQFAALGATMQIVRDAYAADPTMRGAVTTS
ncbi:MAG TPA: MarR family transcriptional regulator [Ornithinibacter sp.]|nr:MarR family transcriptional regulator [Ornithinibacter sp.]